MEYANTGVCQMFMFITMLVAVFCALMTITSIQMFCGVKHENTILIFLGKAAWYTVGAFFSMLKNNVEKIGYILMAICFAFGFVLAMMVIVLNRS